MRAKARRYGAGQRWLESRYPGVPRRPGLVREAARGAAGIAAWTLTARFELANPKFVDRAPRGLRQLRAGTVEFGLGFALAARPFLGLGQLFGFVDAQAVWRFSSWIRTHSMKCPSWVRRRSLWVSSDETRCRSIRVPNRSNAPASTRLQPRARL